MFVQTILIDRLSVPVNLPAFDPQEPFQLIESERVMFGMYVQDAALDACPVGMVKWDHLRLLRTHLLREAWVSRPHDGNE